MACEKSDANHGEYIGSLQCGKIDVTMNEFVWVSCGLHLLSWNRELRERKKPIGKETITAWVNWNLSLNVIFWMQVAIRDFLFRTAFWSGFYEIAVDLRELRLLYSLKELNLCAKSLQNPNYTILWWFGEINSCKFLGKIQFFPDSERFFFNFHFDKNF